MLAAERAAQRLKPVTKDVVINSFGEALKTHFQGTSFVLCRVQKLSQRLTVAACDKAASAHPNVVKMTLKRC